MESLRTPVERFTDLPGFDYQPHYAEVASGDGGTLRMAWVEDGPADGESVLLLHGEPSWSFLYRTMIPPLASAGLRVIAPDLVGFGRSDKPASRDDHSYARHVEWVRSLVFDVLDLRAVTLVCQDWGGLIGLRLVAEHPGRFARIVAANTGLPTGDQPMPEIWWAFREAIQTAPTIDIGRFVQSGCRQPMSGEVRAAYDAPFPDESYQAGPRAMPGLVPTSPEDPATEANRAAWTVLSASPIPGTRRVQRQRPDHRADAADPRERAARRAWPRTSGDRGGRPLPAGGCRPGTGRAHRRVRPHYAEPVASRARTCQPVGRPRSASSPGHLTSRRRTTIALDWRSPRIDPPQLASPQSVSWIKKIAPSIVKRPGCLRRSFRAATSASPLMRTSAARFHNQR